MTDVIYEVFLRKQLEEGMALAEASDILNLTPLPDSDPPCRFIAHFDGCRGLVRDERGEIVEFDKFRMGIWLPPDYLKRVSIPQVLTYLGPHSDPWHPNLRPPFACMDIVPGTSLVDLLYNCFELWNWSLFSTRDDGLNPAASQWARKQERSRFPIDRRPLKRRAVQIALTSTNRKRVS